MLTADAFGILPPIARLTREQAMFYFLSGFTAKLAGTEIGVTEPQPTFSACFGAPFLPQPPAVYAELLGERLDSHDATVWLVNTGWTGGPYGEGERMPIAATRAMLHAACPAGSRRPYRTDGSSASSPGPGARRRLGAARSALHVAGPRGVRPQAASSRACSATTSRSSVKTSRPGSPRPASRLRIPRLPTGRGGRASGLARLYPCTRRPQQPGAARPVASEAVDATHDVLVVGAGCAGMRAAIEAFDVGADVAIVSKIHPVRSHSGAAEGGINAALGNASEDDPENHAFDTVKGSDYLGDQDAIEILCDEAPGDVYQLEHWGAVFSRTDGRAIAQRPFGAAGEPRTAYAADITGHVLIQVLYEQIMKRDILVYEEYFAWKLVVDDGRCQGVICWDLMNGGLEG